MKPFRLTPRQRQQLHALMKTSTDVRTYRRALALLARDRGTPVEEVAAMLGLHRSTISNWSQRYQQQGHPRALVDQAGRGRRRLLTPALLDVLQQALQHKPDQLGYMATEWTVPLLLEHLHRLTGVRVSDDTLRRQLHRMRYRFKRPRYVLMPDPLLEKKRRVRRRLHRIAARSVVLLEDETDLLLFPPLRAAWAKIGEQSHVVLSGRNAKRVLFGALNLATGERVFLRREHHKAADFCQFLHSLRAKYPSGHIALVLDEDPSHTARQSCLLASELDIEFLSLPHRSPELNPVESLWREGKQKVCADRQYRDILGVVLAFLRFLSSLSNEQPLRTAGVLSESFWLRHVRSKLVRKTSAF